MGWLMMCGACLGEGVGQGQGKGEGEGEGQQFASMTHVLDDLPAQSFQLPPRPCLQLVSAAHGWP